MLFAIRIDEREGGRERERERGREGERERERERKREELVLPIWLLLELLADYYLHY